MEYDEMSNEELSENLNELFDTDIFKVNDKTRDEYIRLLKHLEKRRAEV